MLEDVQQRHHLTCLGDQGPVLLLAHGFGCDQRMWRFMAPDLARDHRVVLFDCMGSGRSDARAWRPERYVSLDDHAQDVLEIIQSLSLGEHERVTFVGHSIGSSIGMLAAIARPQLFDALVMVAPNPCFINHPGYHGGFERQDILDLLDLMERNMLQWANFFAPVAMKNEDRPELRDELARSLCGGDPVIVRHMARLVFLSDVREHLCMLKVPSLILQCAEDAVAPAEVGAYLHDHLQGSVLKHMAATGHCPHMSHPEETLACVREYLGARQALQTEVA
jgi:sigma-B regulation protein RsbQ